MLATGTIEKLAMLATATLLVLRLAMPATGTVEKLAMILLVLRLAMPVTPCWPCQLLLASHAGYSLPCRPCRLLLAGHDGYSLPAMLVTPCLASHASYSLPVMPATLCQPCQLLFAGHASYSLPAMLVTPYQPCWLLPADYSLPAMLVTPYRPCQLLLAGHAGTVPCWPCLPSNQLWTVCSSDPPILSNLEVLGPCLIYRSANSSLVSCSLFCNSIWLGTASSWSGREYSY